MGMKLKRLLTGSAALACAALAACGTAAGTGAGTSAHIVADKGLTPQQQAKADAAAMLAAFVPPPGAKRLSSAPTGSGGVLKHKAFTVGVADQLDDVSFWRVPASAASVLAFEKAHLPRPFTLGQWGGVGDIHGTTPHPNGITYGAWYDTWGLSGVPGVIALRALTVEVTDPSSSVAYVRVDANVSWIPARPAAEKVPAGVKVVTITASPDMNHPKGTPAPVTVTSPAKVAQIVALLDGLSLDTGGAHGCLPEAGKGITLSFRAKPGGPVLATAGELIPNCGGVGFTIGGVRQPPLAAGFTSKALAIAGVHWPSWYL
jgi:predicted small secreted protein